MQWGGAGSPFQWLEELPGNLTIKIRWYMWLCFAVSSPLFPTPALITARVNEVEEFIRDKDA